jgi:hypothetical protein
MQNLFTTQSGPAHAARVLASVATLAAIAGCGGAADPAATPVKLSANFGAAVPNCTGSDADYTAATAPPDTISGTAALPAPFQGQGWRLSGTNRSDDLFIYAKCRLTGLKPQQSYRVGFAVEFLTRAPSGCAGVGGAPGEGVTVHAGATAQEPLTQLKGDGYFRVNLDRGNQTVGGSQSQALGHIGNGSSNCSQGQFATKTLEPAALLQTQADAQGGIWLHVGIDSGFEAYSEVYLRSVSVSFTPLAP